VNNRVVWPRSIEESRTRFWNVIKAVGAVWVGMEEAESAGEAVGAGEAVASGPLESAADPADGPTLGDAAAVSWALATASLGMATVEGPGDALGLAIAPEPIRRDPPTSRAPTSNAAPATPIQRRRDSRSRRGR
jgi:hypothetical protein